MRGRWARAGTSLALLGLAAAAHAAPLAAQRPTVSPRLDRAARGDTTLAVWLFARPGASLTELESAVTRLGGEVRRVSRWLHAVSANLRPATLDVFRARTDLRHLQPVAVFRRDVLSPPPPPSPPPHPHRLEAAQPPISSYGASAMPLRRLNLFPLVERGFTGTGIRIALLDTGFETQLPAFAGATVVAQRDFVFNDGVVRDEAGDVPNTSQHGTAIWALLAANVPDTLIGIAPDAVYLLAKTEDVRQEVRTEEDNFVAALEWADSIGVDIVSASLTYRTFDGGTGYQFSDLNGDIAVTTVAADLAAERGITVVVAVGNAGPASRSLGTPADGDSVLAIGAEDSVGVLAGLSSRGPTADGRIKPDFTAPGINVWTLLVVNGIPGYGRISGTSLATPIVAGAAALLKQIHPTAGPVELRDALRAAATNLAAPDTLRGWGRPNAFVSAAFPGGVTLVGPGPPSLSTITPQIGWLAPGVPAFAQPASFRLIVARDTTFADTLLDTTTTQASVTLPPLRPGATFAFRLLATAADSARLTVTGPGLFAAPAWLALTTLNEPAGITIRTQRPRLTWEPAEVSPPFGPFTWDVRILREDGGTVAVEALGLDTTSFTPAGDLEFNVPYRWEVTAHLNGDSVLVQSLGPFVIVQDAVPRVTTLFQNFPNPFPNASIGQTSTCFWFDLARQGSVRLEILDVRGHVVRTLVPGPAVSGFLLAGRYGRPAGGGQCDPDYQWDGRTDGGAMAPGGLYVAKLSTPEGSFFRRLVFLGGAP